MRHITGYHQIISGEYKVGLTATCVSHRKRIRLNLLNSTVFGDPLSDTFDDPDHSVDERRFLIIGHSEKGKLLSVSHADDGETVCIISAREMTRGERDEYEQ